MMTQPTDTVTAPLQVIRSKVVNGGNDGDYSIGVHQLSL